MKKLLNICLFFLVAYGIAHLYVFIKAKDVFYPGPTLSIAIGVFLFIMFCSPLLVHLYISRGPLILSRIFAYASYLWVALLILFISTSLVIEAYNLTLRLGENLLELDLSKIMVSPLSGFLISLFASTILCVYGYFEAKTLRVERLTLKTSKLPGDLNKIKIAHISDLHLGIFERGEKLEKIISEIEKEKPDLIVSTGDMLDGVLTYVDQSADKLNRVHARLGKFAVIGNHEYYAGIKHSLEFLQASGFTPLRGEGTTIQNLINIAGVDDPGFNSCHGHKSEKEILSSLPSDKFTLLIKHRPDIDKSSLGTFDLQLSGHTHKGQIFPINLVTNLLFSPHTGFKKLPDGSAVYVSRGAGTAGPPVRVFTLPEITIIEIVNNRV